MNEKNEFMFGYLLMCLSLLNCPDKDLKLSTDSSFTNFGDYCVGLLTYHAHSSVQNIYVLVCFLETNKRGK